MTITLYKNNSPREYVNKSISAASNITVNLKTPVDVLRPTIILGGVSITGYNYCYIPDFARYYYISDAETYYNNIASRELEVDVLMSYATQIKSLSAVVERQEKYYNLYLEGLNMPNLTYKRIQTKQFPLQPLNVGGTMLLAVSGKGE